MYFIISKQQWKLSEDSEHHAHASLLLEVGKAVAKCRSLITTRGARERGNITCNFVKLLCRFLQLDNLFTSPRKTSERERSPIVYGSVTRECWLEFIDGENSISHIFSNFTRIFRKKKSSLLHVQQAIRRTSSANHMSYFSSCFCELLSLSPQTSSLTKKIDERQRRSIFEQKFHPSQRERESEFGTSGNKLHNEYQNKAEEFSLQRKMASAQLILN